MGRKQNYVKYDKYRPAQKHIHITSPGNARAPIRMQMFPVYFYYFKEN